MSGFHETNPASGGERASQIRGMFTDIAHRYDLMNRLMTAGQDVRWRREVIRRAGLLSESRLLDLGAGTGDLSREALRQQPGCQPVAADFTLKMMQVGKERSRNTQMDWCGADALSLPFPDETFEAIVSGFLLRNVIDLPRALREQYRVLRPGGRMVALDTTRPVKTPFSPLVNFHLHFVIPNLGQLVTGEREAYTYLPDSTAAFLDAEDLVTAMASTGFREVGYRRLMLGTIAIHWGIKQG
jgi:demethylmenaquinone methyltransferase / 2-methoxy-6-polyprenyl-1,4-benzoquinol methylase